MDARLYDLNDMAKIECNDCKGCSACCQGMGESILLDPYDIWQLETNLHTTFAELMKEKIELHVIDGLILPNLKMQDETEQCGFLNEKGRCAVHAFRPGLCRLFPLGRNYEGNKLQYFVLEDACPNRKQTKIKIKKWLAIPESGQYEQFLAAWHALRKELQEKLVRKDIAAIERESSDTADFDEERMKVINMRFLQIFYEESYTPDNFYEQFAYRLKKHRDLL